MPALGVANYEISRRFKDARQFDKYPRRIDEVRENTVAKNPVEKTVWQGNCHRIALNQQTTTRSRLFAGFKKHFCGDIERGHESGRPQDVSQNRKQYAGAGADIQHAAGRRNTQFADNSTEPPGMLWTDHSIPRRSLIVEESAERGRHFPGVICHVRTFLLGEAIVAAANRTDEVMTMVAPAGRSQR